MKKEMKQKKRREKGSLFIPAGLFIGMGLGFLYDLLVEGIFLGLGIGFLVYAIIHLFSSKK
jgi:uncharacterized membrane protein